MKESLTMCWRALIIKSCCCCGLDLHDGAFAWAIIDAILHLCLIPLPNAASELAAFAPYFVAWVGFLILADAVLAFGCKVSM